jgi:hypothetical protein
LILKWAKYSNKHFSKLVEKYSVSLIIGEMQPKPYLTPTRMVTIGKNRNQQVWARTRRNWSPHWWEGEMAQALWEIAWRPPKLKHGTVI